MSGWVPTVFVSGNQYPNQPKFICVKLSLILGASSAGNFRIASFMYSGLKTSNAFPRVNMCQLKWVFAAPSANMGSGFN